MIGVTATPLEDAVPDLRVIAFYRFASTLVNATNAPRLGPDWNKVENAIPNFIGHHQPHRPADFGTYDVSDPAVRTAQASLAAEYGITGFCYYCQWSPAERLLVPTPAELSSASIPDFPFCVCWENGSIDPLAETAQNQTVAMQRFTPLDCVGFIRALLPVFADARYVRIDGRALLIIAQPLALPDIRSVILAWRTECLHAGERDPYICWFGTALGADPSPAGLDAAVEFPPAGFYPESELARLQITNPGFNGEVRSYRSLLAQLLAAERPGRKFYRTVMPAWDATACNQEGAMIFRGDTPEIFAYWVERAAQQTRLRFAGDERLLFVRSWNEWDVGCHLEPDDLHGRQYLDALRDGLARASVAQPERPSLASLVAWGGKSGGITAARIVRSGADSVSAGSGPRVSVVMPAYNHERFVESALDSIVAQTHRRLEIIVVDDGSRDATGTLVDAYAQRCTTHPMTVVHQQNAGAHEAINHGLALARGEVIALMNSDDMYAIPRLARILEEMTRRGAGFGFSNTRFVDEDGVEFGSEDPYVVELRSHIAAASEAPNPLFGLLLANVTISTGNFVFRREVLEHTGGFCSMRVCHDWDFVMAASGATPLAFVDQPLYVYRLHRGNTFSGLKLLGGLEIEQLRTRFFANIMDHPIMDDAARGEKFLEYARRRGLSGYLPHLPSSMS